MKITNNLNLPKPIVDAVTFDDYTRGEADFSVTQLHRPSLQLRLLRDLDEHLEEDAANRIWALFGTAVHNVLERAAQQQEVDPNTFMEEYIVETRKVGTFGPWKVSGKQDVFVPGQNKIIDYKVTSWHAVADGPKTEWVKQLNALACIHRQHGITVDKLQIVAILRDWSYVDAIISKRCAHKVPIAVLDIPVWDNSRAQQYIMDRCASHSFALEVDDPTTIDPCTAEETWERPTQYAVMKKGGKRAIRVLDSQEEADMYLNNYLNKPSKTPKNPKDFRIQIRAGSRPHCERYCAARDYCWAFREWKEKNGIE